MKSFLELYSYVEDELGRGLKEKEVKLLRWMYNRHLKEIAEKGGMKFR